MAEQGAQEAMAELGALETMAEQGAQEAMAELGAQEAMAEQGAQEAMAELGALETMAEQGAQEAMAELGAQEAMAELGAQEAMAGGIRGRGLGHLGPATTAGTFVIPPKNPWGSYGVSGALRGLTNRNRTAHRNRKPSLG